MDPASLWPEAERMAALAQWNPRVPASRVFALLRHSSTACRVTRGFAPGERDNHDAL